MTEDFVEPTSQSLKDPVADEVMTTSVGKTPLRGVIFDWGGVLTPSLDGAVSQWAQGDGADAGHFTAVLQQWLKFSQAAPDVSIDGLEQDRKSDPAQDSPVHRLERGEIDVAEFEEWLAVELSRFGSTVPTSGLLDRLLSGLDQLDERMLGLIRSLRAAGYATALLSNSWGDHYPERLWQGLFDDIVISGRVGMRKPEARIYHHAAQRLGLAPAQCVMIDDLPSNVVAAVATGMVGITHMSWEETLGELEVVLDLDLRETGPGEKG